METFTRIENKFRPIAAKLPPGLFISLYSSGRKSFLNLFVNDLPERRFMPPETNRVKLWDINFSCDLLNAAGMFKEGQGYRTAANQGAGAFLAGTTTAFPREGNQKNNIVHPFSPFPKAGAAINWMGLPNPGHEEVAKRLSTAARLKNCPVGASLSASPEQTGEDAMQSLVEGMNLYEKAGVEFMEINESCPNVPHTDQCGSHCKLEKGLVERLDYISEKFLKVRKHHVPVAVKFSTDTDKEQLPDLLDLLFDLGFDGINIGNTSVEYEKYASEINSSEKKIFYYFIENFGGGVSGRPLKEISLELASAAVDYVAKKQPSQEFHVIRTGGIETREDLELSRAEGISLNQWFTGYFDSFAKYGHSLYEKLFS